MSAKTPGRAVAYPPDVVTLASHTAAGKDQSTSSPARHHDQPTVTRPSSRRLAHLPHAADALIEVHHSDGYPVEGVDDPTAWLTSPHQLHAWVAELDDRIVGHVALTDPQPDDAAAHLWTTSAPGRDDDVAVLGRLFILPTARGHALGEQLVRTAAEYAHQHGRRLVLDVMAKDTAAIRLYDRLGWQRIGTTQHDNGRGQLIPAYCNISPSPSADTARF